ncbi:MAG: hypothetical protein U5R14_15700 [Gemmatimonadota bacterium]|nr:hypothetical protein [Gemmatimonadota bacterium]
MVSPSSIALLETSEHDDAGTTPEDRPFSTVVEGTAVPVRREDLPLPGET